MTIKEIQEIVQVGRHTHKATEGDIDKCAKCGYDLRHPIHLRVNRENNETVADSFVQVAREAVEDELESLNTAKIISTESELILCRDVAIRMLTRIESKLEEL